MEHTLYQPSSAEPGSNDCKTNTSSNGANMIASLFVGLFACLFGWFHWLVFWFYGFIVAGLTLFSLVWFDSFYWVGIDWIRLIGWLVDLIGACSAFLWLDFCQLTCLVWLIGWLIGTLTHWLAHRVSLHYLQHNSSCAAIPCPASSIRPWEQKHKKGVTQSTPHSDTLRLHCVTWQQVQKPKVLFI